MRWLSVLFVDNYIQDTVLLVYIWQEYDLDQNHTRHNQSNKMSFLLSAVILHNTCIQNYLPSYNHVMSIFILDTVTWVGPKKGRRKTGRAILIHF
jgi:uncharacterized protein Usg